MQNKEDSKKNNLCHGDNGGPTFIKGRLAGISGIHSVFLEK
jgi:hypothetical protein